MKTLACLMLCCGLMSWPLCGQPRYKDASLPVEERVEDLLECMTLEEKILQLNQYTLGASDNANNIEEVTARIPAGIGSLIYYEENRDPRFPHSLSDIAGPGLLLEHGFGPGGL